MDYSISLQKVVKNFELISVCNSDKISETMLHVSDVNRPGLPLAGYIEHFDKGRIQLIGRTEYSFLNQLPIEARQSRLNTLFSKLPPAVILTREYKPMPEMIAAAEQFGVPFLSTDENTSTFMASLISFLKVELAPRYTTHGVLVEVYGEGLLLIGDSGVGKSETAIELVKRGHRLIADDAVEIRKVSNNTLVGRSPDNIRYFAELRGIGIINARRLFGMGAVKLTEKIDMVINLEQWDQNKQYDRFGIDNQYTEILDTQVTSITIPVKPGRNLAIIIEVAAMNNRQKKLGFNAGQELLEKLSASAEGMDDSQDWSSY